MAKKTRILLSVLICFSCMITICNPVLALDNAKSDSVINEENADFAEIKSNTALLVTVSDDSQFENYTKSDLKIQRSISLISSKENNDLSKKTLVDDYAIKNESESYNKIYKLDVSYSTEKNTEALINKIKSIDGVESVEYDGVISFDNTFSDINLESENNTLATNSESSDFSSTVEVNDQYYSEQYALSKTKVNMAWAVSMGSSAVKVGVIDSGITKSHSDLNGNVDENISYNFFNSTSPFTDAAGHGTAVAGIIGAKINNSLSVAGIAGNVRLVSLKCFNAFGKANISSIISAIEYAEAKGIKILNCSFGTNESELDSSGYQALKTAIQNYSGIIIAAAGNDGNTQKSYPAAYELNNIISVASTTSADVLDTSSTYGSTVDLAAPGNNIYSTLALSVKKMTGTSFAAPQVTGVVALMKSLNGSLTPSQIRNIIVESVDKLDSLNGKVISGGRLNALKPVLKSANLIAGDVDLSGEITASDSRLALRFTARLESLTAKQKVLADIDEDGVVTASDARTILRMSARLE